VSKHKRTKARGWRWREGREREGRGWSARVAIMAGLQREGEKKRKEEEKKSLAKICLKFEKFKIWSKWWR
jgi:hypothetical protein